MYFKLRATDNPFHKHIHKLEQLSVQIKKKDSVGGAPLKADFTGEDLQNINDAVKSLDEAIEKLKTFKRE